MHGDPQDSLPGGEDPADVTSSGAVPRGGLGPWQPAALAVGGLNSTLGMSPGDVVTATGHKRRNVCPLMERLTELGYFEQVPDEQPTRWRKPHPVEDDQPTRAETATRPGSDGDGEPAGPPLSGPSPAPSRASATGRLAAHPCRDTMTACSRCRPSSSPSRAGAVAAAVAGV